MAATKKEKELATVSSMAENKKRFRLTLTEECLATQSGNPDVAREHYAKKSALTEEEFNQLFPPAGIEVLEEGVPRSEMTIFPRDDEGRPLIWNYQIKGFFKEACKMLRLRKEKDTISHSIANYAKRIDGLIFIGEKSMPFIFEGETSVIQRPLRAMTMKGERVALSTSEVVPAGAYVDIEVICLDDSLWPWVYEMLDYGQFHGLLQWRNAGKGSFVWELLED